MKPAVKPVALREPLHAGLTALGLDLEPAQEEKLLAYLALLSKWNRVYNLTAVRELAAMVTQHLLDSLAVLPYLVGVRSLVDVGSGAGLPGIPLAIARPELAVTLVEGSHKKASFLQQACLELDLRGVAVAWERVERFVPPAPVDAAISRAFAELREFVRLARHLLAPGGLLLAMKGVYPLEELAQLPAEVTLRAVVPLKVPGLVAQRHLVVMEVA